MNQQELIRRVTDLEAQVLAFRDEYERLPDQRAQPLGGGAAVSWGILRGVPGEEQLTCQKLAVTLASHVTVRAAGAPREGVLTERADEQTGLVSQLEEGHGITAEDRVNVTWNGSKRYDLAVTYAGATQVAVQGGAGVELPAAGTPVVVQARKQQVWKLLENTTVIRQTEGDLTAEDYEEWFWYGAEASYPKVIASTEANGLMYLLPIVGSGEDGVVLHHTKAMIAVRPADGWPESDALLSDAGGAVVRLGEA